jgi:uncharacterized lipoprotein YddW (UPF0748 family)
MNKAVGGLLLWILLLAMLLPTIVCAQLTPGTISTAGQGNFQKAIFIDAVGQEMYEQSRATKSFNTVREAQFDTLFIHTRYMGQVYYTSSLEPRSDRIDASFTDPLRYFVYMAHPAEAGSVTLKIYPWVSIMPAYSGRISLMPPIGNILQRHPEWVMLNYKGDRMDNRDIFYIDPGNPSVQEYIESLLVEIVKNYDVDGIILDGFRYPDDGLNWGYNKMALAAYFKDTEVSEKPLPYDPRWCDWRRSQLTNLLKRINRGLKSIKPGLNIYVSAVAWGKAPATREDFRKTLAWSLVFQDWQTWLENGLVDGIVLENYKQFPQQREEFISWLDYAIANRQSGKFICGIGGFFNFTGAIVNQIWMARQKNLDGVAIYCYRVPSQDNPDTVFSSIGQAGFASHIMEFRRASRPTVTPRPTQVEVPTTKTLEIAAITTGTRSMAGFTTATLTMQHTSTPTPTPTPFPVTIPAIPGLPSLPNLAEITPTPVFIPPAPTSPMPEVTKIVPEIQAKPELTPPPPEITPQLPMPPAMPKWDIIQLKNGGQIKGKITEQVGEKTTIETSQGYMMTIPTKDIDRVTKYRQD